MAIPRLRGKSTLKAILLAAAFYATEPCFTEMDSARAAERLQLEFVPKPSDGPAKKYEAVRTGRPLNPAACYPLVGLPGLGIKAERVIPARFYRNDGPVWSVPEYFIRLYKETGQELRPKKGHGYEEDSRKGVQYFKEWMKGAIGGCFFDAWEKDGVDYVIAIPFYRRLHPGTAPWDVFLQAHEDFHIAQRFGMNEAYRTVRERLKKHGYNIKFSDFDKEEQADIGGILAVNENDLPLEEVFKRDNVVGDVFKKMQNYRIPEHVPGLYKPVRTNK